MLSPSLEDYLEEIYRFALMNKTVRVTDISKKLKVSLPSVTKALHKLKDQEYINYERYGEIELTDQGRSKGSFLVRRNQLLQEFLTLIGSNCNVAMEAEAMEHYLSDATIYSIQQLVNFMTTNPKALNAYTEFLEQSPES